MVFPYFSPHAERDAGTFSGETIRPIKVDRGLGGAFERKAVPTDTWMTPCLCVFLPQDAPLNSGQNKGLFLTDLRA